MILCTFLSIAKSYFKNKNCSDVMKYNLVYDLFKKSKFIPNSLKLKKIWPYLLDYIDHARMKENWA